MAENGFPKSFISLTGRSRKKLRLNARIRFILLFALFNAMFCLLVLLSFEYVQLRDKNRENEDTIATLEKEIDELKQSKEVVEYRTPKPIEVGTLQSPLSSLVSPTPYPTCTPYPTYTSVPTDSPILPTLTSGEPDIPVPLGTGVVTLTAIANLSPQIFGITPYTATVGDSAITITLQGNAFAPGAIVKIERKGQTSIIAGDVNVISSTQITSTLDLSHAPPGIWSVRVINPNGQSAILPDVLKVDPAGSE